MKRISVLMVTAFVDMIGFAMVFPLLPFYALRLNAPEWVIGWMIAVFSIAQLASAPLWGRVSDRYGRRPAIIAGLVGGAVAFTVFGLATSIWMLFLSRLVQGLGGGTTAVLQAYVGDASEPKDRAKALGWLSSATSAGVMVGPAIGSLTYSIGPAAPGLIAAALCLTNAVFAVRWLPESKRHTTDQPAYEEGREKRRVRPIREAIWEVVSAPHRQVSRLIWVYAIGMLGFMSTTAVMALYLESAFGVTAQTIGAFFVLVGGLGVVMRALVLGKLVDWLGETKVMRVGATSLMLGIFLIPRAGSVILFSFTMCLIPVGTALLFPTVSALVTHRVRRSELGQTLGVQQAFGGIARVIGPIWSTAVFQGLGSHVPFYIAAGIVFSVLLLSMRIPGTSSMTEVAEPA
jgi:MFS family permease